MATSELLDICNDIIAQYASKCAESAFLAGDDCRCPACRHLADQWEAYYTFPLTSQQKLSQRQEEEAIDDAYPWARAEAQYE